MLFNRILQLRQEHNLTQSYVASTLGITQTVYSRYERGLQTIPLEQLVALSDYYSVSIDYILGRTDNKDKKDG